MATASDGPGSLSKGGTSTSTGIDMGEVVFRNKVEQV